MKNQFTSGIIAVFTMLICISANAQVPVQWTRTLQFEGYWDGPAILTAGGQTFNLLYRMEFKTAVEGSALTMDEWFTDPALGDFKGANLIGYSPFDDQIHWFSADNFGTAHEHTGAWTNPKHLYMEHRSIQGGLQYIERIDVRLKANNQKVEISLIATLGPDTVQVLTGTLIRRHNGNRSVNVTNEPYELSIYPNPTDGKITIESTEIIDEINISNESGQFVYHARPNESDVTLNLKADGIYFVEIIHGNKTETQKIILTK